jgi:nitrate reductase (NAD(P)H)
MLNANRTEEDILCRSELDKLFAVHGPDRFKLHYILSKAPETWTSSVGRINEKLIVDHLPQPSEHGLILVCGPDAMISHAIKPGLRNVGWDINEFLVVF